MPKLRRFDELEHQLASKEDIETARQLAESIIPTSKGPLQFDLISRQRLNAIAYGEDFGTIEWRMADNSSVTFDQQGLQELCGEAVALAGPRAIAAFQKAQGFKATLEAGGELTKRDIAPENW